MKRSSARAAKLAALGKSKFEETQESSTTTTRPEPRGNDEVLPPPESPAVAFNPDVESSYQNFSKMLEKKDSNNYVESTPKKDQFSLPAKKGVTRNDKVLLPPESPAVAFPPDVESSYQNFSKMLEKKDSNNYVESTPNKDQFSSPAKKVVITSSSLALLSQYGSEDSQSSNSSPAKKQIFFLTPTKTHQTPLPKSIIVESENIKQTLDDEMDNMEDYSDSDSLGVAELSNLSIDDDGIPNFFNISIDDSCGENRINKNTSSSSRLHPTLLVPDIQVSGGNDTVLDSEANTSSIEGPPLCTDDISGKSYAVLVQAAVAVQNMSNISVPEVSTTEKNETEILSFIAAQTPVISLREAFHESLFVDALDSVELLHTGETVVPDSPVRPEEVNLLHTGKTVVPDSPVRPEEVDLLHTGEPVMPDSPVRPEENRDIQVNSTPPAINNVNTESAANTDENNNEERTLEEEYPQPRSCKPEKWKRNIIKNLHNSGLPHTSLKGAERKARSISQGCTMECKRKCHYNFSEDHRQTIFRDFWAQKDHVKQWAYISCHVTSDSVQRRTTIEIPGNKPRRQWSNNYRLPLESGVQSQVCQKFFLGTIGVTEKWVRTAQNKYRENSGTIAEDNRGKVKKQSLVHTVIKLDIMNHIKKFKTIEGHYTRKNSKARYLPESLNKRKMYAMYVIEKQAEGATKIASLKQYRNVFRKEFHLKFYKPKKDQCARCLSWKNRTPRERTEEAKQRYEKHISDKKAAETAKVQDIEEIKNSPELQKKVCLFSCDLEKTLECPKGNNGEFYYKSKLTVYNFTIFVSGEQKGYCFVWDQTEANRGSAEITSCLWYFMQKKIESGIKEFRIYSDNCSAQNKNQFLFSMYVMASIRFQIKITHRYLEVGHTHMEVDSVHACIESSVKNTDIFVPSQWYTAMRLAKKSRPLYEVKEMTQEEIYNFKPLATHQCWDKIKTSLIKEVCFDGAEPGIVKYKQEYSQDYTIVNVLKQKSVGRPVNWKTIALKKQYNGKIPLKPHELKDLQSLCHSGAIPSIYAKLYLETLPLIAATGRNQPPPDEIPDLEDSFEVEEPLDLPESEGEEDAEGGSVSDNSDQDYIP